MGKYFSPIVLWDLKSWIWKKELVSYCPVFVEPRNKQDNKCSSCEAGENWTRERAEIIWKRAEHQRNRHNKTHDCWENSIFVLSHTITSFRMGLHQITVHILSMTEGAVTVFFLEIAKDLFLTRFRSLWHDRHDYFEIKTAKNIPHLACGMFFLSFLRQ